MLLQIWFIISLQKKKENNLFIMQYILARNLNKLSIKIKIKDNKKFSNKSNPKKKNKKIYYNQLLNNNLYSKKKTALKLKKIQIIILLG